jgi:ribosomal protein L6P/L9E
MTPTKVFDKAIDNIFDNVTGVVDSIQNNKSDTMKFKIGVKMETDGDINEYLDGVKFDAEIGANLKDLELGLQIETDAGDTDLTEADKFDSTVFVKDGGVYVTPKNDTKIARQMHGTTNANIKNMIVGVTDGYTKGLEAVGVGYRFQVSGNKINISAGFSHPVVIEVPAGLKAEQISNTEINIIGINDKFLIALFTLLNQLIFEFKAMCISVILLNSNFKLSAI